MTPRSDGADDAIEPDTKDWTWVLAGPVPIAVTTPRRDPHRRRRPHPSRRRRLGDPAGSARVTDRPAPGVWSVLEYGCHVRDVHRIFDQRVHLMLAEDDPQFPNWDQDETALADDYGAQDPTPSQTSCGGGERGRRYLRAVPDDAWSRRGLRSNGSEFTIASSRSITFTTSSITPGTSIQRFDRDASDPSDHLTATRWSPFVETRHGPAHEILTMSLLLVLSSNLRPSRLGRRA